jgi:hypothetical protein
MEAFSWGSAVSKNALFVYLYSQLLSLLRAVLRDRFLCVHQRRFVKMHQEGEKEQEENPFPSCRSENFQWVTHRN